MDPEEILNISKDILDQLISSESDQSSDGPEDEESEEDDLPEL